MKPPLNKGTVFEKQGLRGKLSQVSKLSGPMGVHEPPTVQSQPGPPREGAQFTWFTPSWVHIFCHQPPCGSPFPGWWAKS